MVYAFLKSRYKFGRLYNTYLIQTTDAKAVADEVWEFASEYLLDINSQSTYHPDYIILQKESSVNSISVNQIRNLQKIMHSTPSIAKNKVVVILNAEQMNLNAANACLKLLEDTPPNSYLFLLTNTISSIIPTIRSRCSRIYDKTNLTGPLDSYKNCITNLSSENIEAHINLLHEFSKKDRQAFSEFADNIIFLLSRIVKNRLSMNINLEDYESGISNKLGSLPISLLINKFEKIEKIIHQTMLFDLDLRTSYVILYNELLTSK